MQDTTIRVEKLGKKYKIAHQTGGQRLIREVLSDSLKTLARTGRRPRVETEEFWALRDVSLDIRRGDVVGVIGRNGAGKSTFLKLLSRITQPSEGSIEFSGRIASLLEVGTGFHAELSGRENIFLNGAIMGMQRTETRRKFDQIVEFSGVEKFLDTPVKHYSSGMYMRLAFAVAAHLEPDILIVDEVLAVGDGEFQKKCLGKMKEVAQDGGRTVIFVSHNIQAVKALCNRALHLQRGRAVATGATDEVIREYLTSNSLTSGTWVNPDPECRSPYGVRLLSVTTGDRFGSQGTYFSSNDLTISLTIHLAKITPSLCVGFDVVTSDGTTVFRSYQTDQPEQQWLRQVVGIQTWTCTIPGGLFNAGEYHVSPRISIHNVGGVVMLDAVLRFEVTLDHGLSPFLRSERGRPGVISPVMSWSEA